ncbi:hypothetical protein BDFB_009733 [Asbolus verrucosus]|uniref:Uncharacterized protein n=1 Tax=Asbolus verrucosus TaxID=1661398 RepID=A0A482W3L6_ASBVE|nr:hypothetical protein BDFB_009733 [Asbolus verrucosus]
MANTEAEIATIRGELEMVQKALKLQTKRCRQLVTEYTRRLQQKEQQYQSEKALRDDQLAKVLRALIIFEARLKQEQKFISHQLKEKDYIIKKQSNEIKKLLSSQYCKNCNQYYSPSPNLESLDSSSEYVVTDYQSSNFESLDSSSDIYATISEKSFNTDKQGSGDDNSKTESEPTKTIYLKNKGKDSLGRRAKKFQHRKSVGTYFEVLKLRNDSFSPCSNEDNTSNDYDNLDSLPAESITDKISVASERIENIFNSSQNHSDNTKENDSSSNLSVSECNNTVINKIQKETKEESQRSDNYTSDRDSKSNNTNESKEKPENKLSKITDSIPVFEGDGEANDNWYASASDQEDDEQRDIYRNNPVLECMNQILLQNINDSMNSPPKTPNIERKPLKNKKVKFSDEEDNKQTPNILTKENVKENTQENGSHGYYETPIQKVPNFYETPQSIYSNDYEQILSKCSETFTSNKAENGQEKDANRMVFKKAGVLKNFDSESKNHFYVDLDTKSENEEKDVPVRRVKILRTPPALPPKPANLVMKYKLQCSPTKLMSSSEILESEPDYCSISELNLPTNKSVSFKKINVVAEINPPNSQDVMSKLEKASKKKSVDSDYDPVVVNDNIPNLVVKKCVEKLNIQLAKQTPIKSEASPKKNEPEIPKLPQVSEIIIPEDNEEKQQEERISHDNYVKNNSQILKLKTNNKFEQNRRSIVMGTSVSTLITGFNNQQLISEINKKPERNKLDKRVFSSFENLQNLDKPTKKDQETPNFDKFDLSQNFEEFKLDDCEIEEYNVNDIPDINEEEVKTDTIVVDDKAKPNSTRVELIRATNDTHVPNLNVSSVELLKRQLELQKNKVPSEQVLKENPHLKRNSEPTYEHFLECTGLSSKSILTPSRLLSNHKSMLKPKDIKLRSKVKANLFERHSTSTIKYWSEPYI